jgi:DNA-binding SARP family transcriptional activator
MGAVREGRPQCLAMGALERLSDWYEKQGHVERALEYAWRRVDLEPWDEVAHQQVMRLWARSGRRTEALAQYETCRHLLSEELGVEPAAETTRMYEQIQLWPFPTVPSLCRWQPFPRPRAYSPPWPTPSRCA